MKPGIAAPTRLPLFHTETALRPLLPPAAEIPLYLQSIRRNKALDYKITPSFSDSGWPALKGKNKPSAAPPPLHPFFVFGLLRKQRVPRWLPSRVPPPSQNSPKAAKLSEKESEPFPGGGQHISDVDQRHGCSCGRPLTPSTFRHTAPGPHTH